MHSLEKGIKKPDDDELVFSKGDDIQFRKR